jgi:predicted esterase
MPTVSGDHARGRISSRPTGKRGDAGFPERPEIRWPLGQAPGAPMLLVPPRTGAGPVGLVVLLHGAGATAAGILPVLEDEAVRRGLLVLAPKSGHGTWDVISGGFGPDVSVLDETLAAVFAGVDVDPERVAISGFSDGASYALSLGLINGDLFRRIIAFSPGFVVAPTREGTPAVFVSHGRSDPVLPIDQCSRRLVPVLRAEGYDVDYREFAGRHEVPPEMVRAGLEPLG